MKRGGGLLISGLLPPENWGAQRQVGETYSAERKKNLGPSSVGITPKKKKKETPQRVPSGEGRRNCQFFRKIVFHKKTKNKQDDERER